MYKFKKKPTALTLFGLYSKAKKNYNNYLKGNYEIGFFGAITMESIVINDVVNNKVTFQGYPETQFLGISAYSYEYRLAFRTILGVFKFFAGLFMDSKKKKQDLTK